MNGVQQLLVWGWGIFAALLVAFRACAYLEKRPPRDDG